MFEGVPTSGAFRSLRRLHPGRGGNRNPARHGESGGRGHSKPHDSSDKISQAPEPALASAQELVLGQVRVLVRGPVGVRARAVAQVQELVPERVQGLVLVPERGGTGLAVVLGSG